MSGYIIIQFYTCVGHIHLLYIGTRLFQKVHEGWEHFCPPHIFWKLLWGVGTGPCQMFLWNLGPGQLNFFYGFFKYFLVFVSGVMLLFFANKKKMKTFRADSDQKLSGRAGPVQKTPGQTRPTWKISDRAGSTSKTSGLAGLALFWFGPNWPGQPGPDLWLLYVSKTNPTSFTVTWCPWTRS